MFALVGYRVLVVAMLSVATWSVAQAHPGWVAWQRFSWSW